MNLLVENTSNYIIIKNKKIPIKTDFSVWVNLIISVKKNDIEKITNSIEDIFGGIPTDFNFEDFIEAFPKWLWNETDEDINKTSTEQVQRTAFDFNDDGNIIYCELYQYFPQLMQKGISFHEGLELIKILLSNENTILHHRAYARCGDFSKLDKERRKYWQQERAKYAVKISQKELDSVFSNGF